MDVRDATWSASEVTGHHAISGREGIGRGMKVGREQIVGLVAAVREYLDDPHAWDRRYLAEVAACRAAVAAGPVRTTDQHNVDLDVPLLVLDFADTAIDADTVARQLDEGTPRIHLGESQAWRNRLIVNPMALAPGEGARIGERVAAIVRAAADGR